MGRGGESMVQDNLRRHVVTRLTDEGLVVELFELDGAPLFDAGTDTPTALLHELSAMLVRVFALVRNPVAIEGHVAAQPLVLADKTSWRLSVARADAMRLLLEDQGLATNRVTRVTGHADREPALRNPMAPRNNRLEVILLRTQG